MINWQERTPALRGMGVELRRLAAEDAEALMAVTPRDCFQFFLSEPAAWTLDAFRAWLESYVLQPAHMSWAVLDARTGRLVGSTSYLDILPEHRHVEIGVTWYALEARGKVVNPACKHLLLAHAFERMFGEGALRVTLKCNAKNEASKRAIAKMGGVYEGTLRNHRVKACADGRREVRDTAYFSVLREEWPAVSAGLRARVEAMQ